MDTVFKWRENTFWLSGQRVMYWEEKRTLIASDLHLGKSGHFRKSGIAVPQELMKQDLMRLFSLLQHYQPERLLIVGDFFHSHANKELDWFARWRKDASTVSILLIRGNHDILDPAWYADNEITVMDRLDENELRFVHEPAIPSATSATMATICGHIHPGISINGMGRQSLRLPCFYFNRDQCLLPAFGLFTGTYTLKPRKKDFVFAIANQKIIQVSP